MGKVIASENTDKHNIEKFHFSPLHVENINKAQENLTSEDIFSNTFDTQEIKKPVKKNDIKEEANDLLEKIDALTSEKVKLEMELESIKKEQDNLLEISIKEAFENGKKEGIQESGDSFQDGIDELKIQLVKSIGSLDEELEHQKEFIKKIEDEIVNSSVEIAKKVIKKELDLNSQEIALNLSRDFLANLKDAKSIKLKVNPQDAKYLTNKLEDMKNLIIDEDDAITKGGVIILSDIGNIDGDISTRIQKVVSLLKNGN